MRMFETVYRTECKACFGWFIAGREGDERLFRIVDFRDDVYHGEGPITPGRRFKGDLAVCIRLDEIKWYECSACGRTCNYMARFDKCWG